MLKPNVSDTARPQMYDGEGDALMSRPQADLGERILLVPDAPPSKIPDPRPRMRIMWGQHLLEDVLLGRYRSLICAVNSQDNAHGIISQLARVLPTSQWDERSITHYAAHHGATDEERVKVLKYDMDMVEILAILRPAREAYLTIDHLASAFKVVASMIHRQPGRIPSASVSFIGARANRLVDKTGHEPSFESVLRIMHDAGYTGDVYPAPAMWNLGQVNLFARYPFPAILDRLRDGGY